MTGSPDAERRPPAKGAPSHTSIAARRTDKHNGRPRRWNPYLYRVRWRAQHWQPETRQVRYFSRGHHAHRFARWKRAEGADVDLCRSDARVTWVADDG